MRRGVMAAALALLLGACGSGGDPGGSTSGPDTGTSDGQGVEFAKCMRDNGVDVPDQGPDGGKLGALAGADRSNPAFKDALAACEEHLPGGGDLSTSDPERLERLREFAKCMREHGVDMPDPDPSGAKLGGAGKLDRDSPAFKAALEACQDKLPELIR
ncbi:hypothetical protein FHS29_006642 [Saccharothrix tamanrassetensis]|uniref:Secreted protein n=1 Tax=Saccharothrix tamanrassetensis TaxID=1051531 RepID=A0A841CRZ2_9PSEU|nr:hypothetical protein [Saccharothrix tamanrassetensis]MBB5960020.1 hypothetical protein [Saccharothrix tamanrassetensis]